VTDLPTVPKPLHLDPEWLRRKYIDECLTTVEIGRIVGRDMKSVWSQLKRFGIPTRPRAFYLRAGPKGHNFMHRPGAVNPFLGRRHSEATRQLLSVKAMGRPGMVGPRNGMYGVHGPAHPSWKGGITPERQRVHRSEAWRLTAHLIYKRDRMTCRRCGTSLLHAGPAPHIHHRVSFSDPTLRFDLDNLVLLCQACHYWVHSRKNVRGEFLGGGDAPVWGEKFRPDSSR
jgi:hypothetical protein